MPGRVTHLVATENFAGVERYLTYVTPLLVSAGWDVLVIGGDPMVMPSVFAGSGVAWQRHAGPLRSIHAVRRSHPDVIHAHMTTAEALAVAARATTNAGVVATRHFARLRGSSRMARSLGARVARHIDRQVAISHFVASTIEDQATVIPNAVPDAPAGRHDQRVVLVAQRLDEEKDTATALRAWQLSGLADEGWELHVAGRGDDRAGLEQLAAELGVVDSVKFLGFVPDLGRLMASAGLLLATAPAEPFGLAVLEAMACGLPIVAAAGGGHLETIGWLDDAWMFPIGNAAAAGRALRDLANDRAARDDICLELGRRQREHHSLEGHVAALAAVYEDVLRRS